MSCEHIQKFHISAKCGGTCSFTFPDGARWDGYVPEVPGIGGGDYIDLDICLTCKQVVDFDPQDVFQVQEEDEDNSENDDGHYDSCSECGKYSIVTYDTDDDIWVCDDCN